jgi:hypothetical protein
MDSMTMDNTEPTPVVVAAVQLDPPFVVLNAPSGPPAYTVDVTGSIASDITAGIVRPVFIAVHVAPASTLFDTPPVRPVRPT